MKGHRKNSAIVIIILAIGVAFFFFFIKKTPDVVTVIVPNEPTIAPAPTPENPEPIKPPSEPLPEPKPIEDAHQYYSYTVKTKDAKTELAKLVGEENIPAILQTNRIDLDNIKSGAKLVIPEAFDLSSRSPFPLEVPEATDVVKLMVINQRVQAFGVYEFGKLVRWGPTSTGKQSTKTANGLFSTNWKGVEVKSSFDDEWVLKYNFNFDNFEGIGFHQYSMPGYPASHACVRLLLDDAMWLYEWADQWILSPNEQSRLAHGTPILIFGDYEFGKTAPWKLLPSDATAMQITEDEISAAIAPYKETIMKWQDERTELLSKIEKE